MNENNYANLAKARIERAKELLQDAELLLGQESQASANNRVYYALEKACTALLASEKIQTKSHRGIIARFNQYFASTPYPKFLCKFLRIFFRGCMSKNIGVAGYAEAF